MTITFPLGLGQFRAGMLDQAQRLVHIVRALLAMPKTPLLPMPYQARRLVFLLVLLASSAAEAQISPGGMPGGGPGDGRRAGRRDDPGRRREEGRRRRGGAQDRGPAADDAALPAQKSRRKNWKLLEMDGYYRVRTDWFKNFNLGFIDDPTLGGAPFPRALGCTPAAVGASATWRPSVQRHARRARTCGFASSRRSTSTRARRSTSRPTCSTTCSSARRRRPELQRRLQRRRTGRRSARSATRSRRRCRA